jgi:hypothetical protein
MFSLQSLIQSNFQKHKINHKNSSKPGLFLKVNVIIGHKDFIEVCKDLTNSHLKYKWKCNFNLLNEKFLVEKGNNSIKNSPTLEKYK